jgi:hypothetical protein
VHDRTRVETRGRVVMATMYHVCRADGQVTFVTNDYDEAVKRFVSGGSIYSLWFPGDRIAGVCTAILRTADAMNGAAVSQEREQLSLPLEDSAGDLGQGLRED